MISPDFEQAAHALNSKRDLLTQQINTLDEQLKKLNCGVVCWVIDDSAGNGVGVGHAKVNKKWGLALTDGTTEWTYNEAPTPLRIWGASHLQALLDKLVVAIETLTHELGEATEIISGIVSAMEEVDG